MNEDPDELRYEMERAAKDPIVQVQNIRHAADEIAILLRYGIPSLKLIGWLIVMLLSLILWRIWGA